MVILPEAFIHVTIWSSKSALTMELVLFPVALIQSTIRCQIGAITVDIIAYPFTGIDSSIFIIVSIFFSTLWIVFWSKLIIAWKLERSWNGWSGFEVTIDPVVEWVFGSFSFFLFLLGFSCVSWWVRVLVIVMVVWALALLIIDLLL